MRSRLIALLEAWAEREMIRTHGRGLRIPDAGFVWLRGKTGWHRGSYDAHGRFVPLQPSFVLIPGTGRKENIRLEEFGVAFRTLEILEQGLIVVGHFGRNDEWRGYREASGLANRHAERRLRQAWGKLILQCKKRGLI